MDIEAEIERMKCHIRLLASAIDIREHPIPWLVVEFDWNEDQLEKAHDLFEKYDKMLGEGKKPSWTELETDLKNEFAISYQSVKSIVNAFYRNGQWLEVCQWFAEGHQPGCPTELQHILERRRH